MDLPIETKDETTTASEVKTIMRRILPRLIGAKTLLTPFLRGLKLLQWKKANSQQVEGQLLMDHGCQPPP